MLENYNPFVTAISRSKLSAPMRMMEEKKLLHGYMLDFGTGKGYDVQHLCELGYNIRGYDKYNPQFNDITLLDDFYHVITCNYVFNVIADWKELFDTRKILRESAQEIYVSVRADIKAIKPTWEYDDYLLGYWNNRAFQRFYTPDMVIEQFAPVTFININDGFILFKLEVENESSREFNVCP